LSALDQLQVSNGTQFGISAKFAEAAFDVGLDGAKADIQNGCDFLVRKIPREMINHLALAAAKGHCDGHGASDSSVFIAVNWGVLPSRFYGTQSRGLFRFGKSGKMSPVNLPAAETSPKIIILYEPEAAGVLSA
jgi:hypothetical protein